MLPDAPAHSRATLRLRDGYAVPAWRDVVVLLRGHRQCVSSALDGQRLTFAGIALTFARIALTSVP
jgi:hypothetical protein